eukprot:6208155-Pleurochrysis_carterae.AAC.2
MRAAGCFAFARARVAQRHAVAAIEPLSRLLAGLRCRATSLGDFSFLVPSDDQHQRFAYKARASSFSMRQLVWAALLEG